MVIEKAKIRDAEVIADFQIKMALESEGLILDKALIHNGVKAVFEDKSKGCYYITRNASNTIMASLLITYEWSDWRNKWVWWIQSVYVVPEFRRKGIFSQMYEYIKERVEADESVAGIRLYVEKKNTKAIETYKAMGMNGEHYHLFEWMKY